MLSQSFHFSIFALLCFGLLWFALLCFDKRVSFHIFDRIFCVKIKNETCSEELQNVVDGSFTNPGDTNTKICGYGSNDSTPPTTPTA